METDLFQDEPSLFERLCHPFWLGSGFAAVKKNRGAAGVDGMSIDAFEAHVEQELSQLSQELHSWTYKPQPVRRVEIDKPDGGIRLLGIPCTRDRVVHATLKRLLEPILTPQFSDHSFGFIRVLPASMPDIYPHLAFNVLQYDLYQTQEEDHDSSSSRFVTHACHDDS